MNVIDNMQDRERLIDNNQTKPKQAKNFSNLSLLDRIKAAQQQLNTKPEVAAMNSGRSGYKAPGVPTEKVSVPKEEDPMYIAASTTTQEDDQVEEELNIEEDVAFMHEPSDAYQPNTESSSATPASKSTNSMNKEDLEFSSFHIEPMLSSMYQGIQKRVDGFLRPSSYGDTDEPLLSQNRESNYSMKVYCITMLNDIYGFSIGRLPVKYRKAASVAVVIFILLLVFSAFGII